MKVRTERRHDSPDLNLNARNKTKNKSASCKHAGAGSQNCGLSSEKKNSRISNSDFVVRKVQSSKIHFYTVEERTKEIFIGTKILAAESSSPPS